MKRVWFVASAVAAWLGPLAAAKAGPCVVEGTGDAGSSVPTAATSAVAGRTCISGALSSASLRDISAVDFEDVWAIRITDPANFSAATTPPAPGDADFDTQLWLFSATGTGLLGNNNDGALAGSRMGRLSNDGTGIVINAPGLYFLAISGAGNAPRSAGGPIFNLALQTEVSGPDGPGGGEPLSGWTGPGAVGTYVIALTGAEVATAIPTTSEWGLVVMAILLLTAGTVVFRYSHAAAAKVAA